METNLRRRKIKWRNFRLSVCVSELINYRATMKFADREKAAVANCADPIQIYLARYWIWGRSQRRPGLPMSCAVTDIPVVVAVLCWRCTSCLWNVWALPAALPGRRASWPPFCCASAPPAVVSVHVDQTNESISQPIASNKRRNIAVGHLSVNELIACSTVQTCDNS
jgi:hypothetical protein